MPPSLDRTMPVFAVLSLKPAAIRVFMEHRMLCIGCPVARLHSLDEACRLHGEDPDAIVAEIERRQATILRLPRARRRSATAGADRRR